MKGLWQTLKKKKKIKINIQNPIIEVSTWKYRNSAIYIKLWAFTVDIDSQDTKGARANGGKNSAEDYILEFLNLNFPVRCIRSHARVSAASVFRDQAGQSNYNNLQHWLYHKERLEHWVSLNPANFILMEVRDKNIGDSKFGLPQFSSVEAASIMETEYEGSTVKCAAKTAQSRQRLETCLCREEIWSFWVYLNENAEERPFLNLMMKWNLRCRRIFGK